MRSRTNNTTLSREQMRDARGALACNTRRRRLSSKKSIYECSHAVVPSLHPVVGPLSDKVKGVEGHDLGGCHKYLACAASPRRGWAH